MLGFKGFDKDWKCKGFQFEIGKTYTHDGDVSLCNSGFHFCTEPMNCFDYYSPDSSVYAQVEATDVSDKKDNDSKRVCKTIKILRQITYKEMASAMIDALMIATKGKNDSAKIGSSGDYAKIGSSGDSAQIGSSGDSAKIEVEGIGTVASAIGIASTIKASKGTWIVLAEYKDDKPVCVKTGQIGKNGLKPGVWYTLKGGKFVVVR